MHIYVITPSKGGREKPLIEQLSQLRNHSFSTLPALVLDEVPADYSQRFPLALYARELRPGEIGCAASHQIAYQAIATKRDLWSCVMEDDARIVNVKEFDDLLHQIETSIPAEKGEVVSFFTDVAFLAESPIAGINDCVTAPLNTVAYAISFHAAQSLITANKGLRFVADWPLGTAVKFRLKFPFAINHGDSETQSLIEGRTPRGITVLRKLEIYSFAPFFRNRNCFKSPLEYFHIFLKPRLTWHRAKLTRGIEQHDSGLFFISSSGKLEASVRRLAVAFIAVKTKQRWCRRKAASKASIS